LTLSERVRHAGLEVVGWAAFLQGRNAMLRLRGAPVGALLVFCAAASAGAQDISGKAREAEGFAAQGKFIEAIAALDDASTALWDKAPLSFRKALWVAEAPAGFGAYNPRETNIYASGAEMLAYIEPVGFGWRKSGDVWRTDLAADLVVKAKDGTELFRQDDFEKLQISSRVRNREFMARFTYTLTGIPAGEYMIDTILRDAVTGKSGTVSLPIVVR